MNDTTPALNATNLNKMQQNVEDVTGDLTDLETSDKSNLVAAINEAASTGSGGDTLPIYSIVDYDGDTVPTGYEKVDSYSTSEVKTGDTWIDNKPMYRKVIDAGTVDFYSSTDKNINHLITNLDTIVSIKYVMYFPGDSNYYTQWDKIITVKGNSTKITFTTGNISSTYVRFTDTKIIVEYTKTTDGGNS